MVMTTTIQKVVLSQQFKDPTFLEELQQPGTRRDEGLHPRTGYPNGFNEALDGFSEEEWPTSGKDGRDDDTILMNLSPNKLMGLNLSFAIAATGFPSVLSAQASILLQNVLPFIWLRFRWEHRSEWTHNNMIACSTAAIKVGPCSSSGFHVEWYERKVILHLTNTFEHEVFLQDSKFKGVIISLEEAVGPREVFFWHSVVTWIRIWWASVFNLYKLPIEASFADDYAPTFWIPHHSS